MQAGDALKWVNQNRKLAAGIILLLLLAGFMNAATESGLQATAKLKQAQQEQQMHDAVQKHSEDLQRQQIEADAQRATELQNALKQFASVLAYDDSQLNETMNEYGESRITDSNADKKIAAAKKFALQLNEFVSHLEGFAQFVLENQAELEKALGKDVVAPLIDSAQSVEEAKTEFNKVKQVLALDLEKYAGSNQARLTKISEAVSLLRGEESA